MCWTSSIWCGTDGANTMIKIVQYLAEADPIRVLVALDLKAAFQNVSRQIIKYRV